MREEGRGGGRLRRRLESYYLGRGGWPAEMLELKLMDRLNSSWPELQETPAIVVEDAMRDIVAKSAADRINRRWSERK